MKLRQQQHGMTLLELLVALFLGLLILSGVVQVYLASKQSYRLDESLARLQENGRYALNLLSEEIRMSGYLGCESRGDIVWTNHVSGDYSYDPTGSGLQGFKEGDTGWDLAMDYEDADDITLVDNSDVLRVMYGNPNAIDFGDSMAEPTSPVPVIGDYSSELGTGDLAIVTDCTFGDLFKVAPSDGSGPEDANNTTRFKPVASAACPPICDPDDDSASCQHLCFKYARPAMLMEVATTDFFIGHKDGEDLPSFYRRHHTETAAQPVVEGIEDMQILYGVDSDGDDYADGVYLDASSVTDWSTVASVNLCLQFASTEDNVLDTATSITGCNGSATDSDRRLRQLYTTTVTLRNQLQ